MDKIEPEIRPGTPMRLAGLGARHKMGAGRGISAQWQTFVPMIYGIADKMDPKTTYGVCYDFDQNTGEMNYFCGVETDSAELPPSVEMLVIPAQGYAVFHHPGHLSSISQTWMAIFNQWLPQCDYEITDGPEIECYGPKFDGRTGKGGVDIWIPVKAKTG